MIAGGIYKAYGRNEVLKGAGLELSPGRITAVLGPNGSGKTTLIKVLLGMVIPQKGRVEVSGKAVGHDVRYRGEIGYLPQIARFPENLKVKELIAMMADLRNKPARPEPLVELFGLERFLNKPLRHLSGGTRQKVNILIAFMFDTPYYILDEPTVGLDPLALIRFKDLIVKERNNGKAILMTTHMVHLVEELADEVVFLLEGQVYFRGGVNELMDKYRGLNLEAAIANILATKEHA